MRVLMFLYTAIYFVCSYLLLNEICFVDGGVIAVVIYNYLLISICISCIVSMVNLVFIKVGSYKYSIVIVLIVINILPCVVWLVSCL